MEQIIYHDVLRKLEALPEGPIELYSWEEWVSGATSSGFTTSGFSVSHVLRRRASHVYR